MAGQAVSGGTTSEHAMRGRRVSLEQICEYYGISRQGHYRQLRAEAERSDVEQRIVEMVAEQRRQMPRLGTRKLWTLIAPDLKQRGIAYGRDKLFGLLRRRGMLVESRARTVRTTNSRHGLPSYENLLRQVQPSRPHQVMVSDITYIETRQGFRYLALVMDAYSRKIIGYDLSASLSIEGSRRAVLMALKQLPLKQQTTGNDALGNDALAQTTDQQVIHHSDRGVQYCSHAYTSLLRHYNVSISMAAVGNPYENAQAERLNGILKQEFFLNTCFANDSEAHQALGQAVVLYNTKRPHTALNYLTPEAVHAAGSATLSINSSL
jgi:transposase InsO family protein